MSDQRNDQEEEFFHRQDQEKLRRLREMEEMRTAAEEEGDLKALHHFRCGKCGQKMSSQTFRGIEVEICPGCGAVLLDPGELEKLTGEDKGGVARTIADFFRFTKDNDQG
jgi:hypothetical protein